MDTQQHGAQPWVAPGEPIISVRGVTKSFGSHTVLEDVTFDVPKGRSNAGLNGPETEKTPPAPGGAARNQRRSLLRLAQSPAAAPHTVSTMRRLTT